MPARYYQILLGVPAEIPAPDYFQLLGGSADAFDEEVLRQGLRDRLDRLDAAPESLRPMAQQLKRELQRARSTIMDPKRRAEYVAQLGEQRRRSISAFIEALVVDGVLWDETERALLRRFAVLGLSAEDTSAAVDVALESLGAQRGEGGGPNEDEEVLERMHEVAGFQLLEAAGMEAPALARREARKVAPAPPEPAPPEPAPEPHFESEVSAPEPAAVAQPEPPVQEPEPAPVPEPAVTEPARVPEAQPPREDPEAAPIRRAPRKEPLPVKAPEPPPRIKAPSPIAPPPTEREGEGPIRRERRPKPEPKPAPAPVEAPTPLAVPGSDPRIPVSDPFGPSDSSGVIPIPKLSPEAAPALEPSSSDEVPIPELSREPAIVLEPSSSDEVPVPELTPSLQPASSDEVPIPKLSPEPAPALEPSSSDEVPIPKLSPEPRPALMPSSGEVPVPDVNLGVEDSGERPRRAKPALDDSSSEVVVPTLVAKGPPGPAKPVSPSWGARPAPPRAEPERPRPPEPERKRPPEPERPRPPEPERKRPPEPELEPEPRLQLEPEPEPEPKRPPAPREKPVELEVPEEEPEPAPPPRPRAATPTPKTREPRPAKPRREVAAAPSEEEAMIDERERRGARRASRTWFALFLIALAFAAGELVGAFVPSVSTSVEASTAPYRQKVLEIPDVQTYALVAAGVAVLLFGLLIYVAGRERRRGVLLLTFIFILPSLYMGLIPLGRLRALLADRAGFDAKLDAAAADRDRAVADRDKAAGDRDKVAAEREQSEKKVVELEKRSVELEKRLAEQAEPLEALRRKLDDMVAVLDSSTRAAEAQRVRQDQVIDALRKELEELKKKPKQE
jgi:hypothetical protein